MSPQNEKVVKKKKIKKILIPKTQRDEQIEEVCNSGRVKSTSRRKLNKANYRLNLNLGNMKSRTENKNKHIHHTHHDFVIPSENLYSHKHINNL